ncbi:uncharacterized protein LOC121426231 [Lytechinus variegatus]|uniref:uncharacterized protein LOC121426231 n=1 Tax=Lytechinus variegatus TaxID=7654 RepID=UPI001BB26137|nr:uncharacterized protein LOC121426231 [Lytechinus variegatus]
MDEKQVKVSLWCVPRSLSTVLTKCLSVIDETEVYFELFSHADAASNMFKSIVGRRLPSQLEGNEKDYDQMSELFNAMSIGRKIIQRRASFLDIKQDLENASSRYVVCKDMAYTYAQEYLPRGFRHVFLTREPSRVFASYRKSILAAAPSIPESHHPKHAADEREFDIIRDDVASTRPKSWYEKQHELWKYVREHIEPNPIIIDAFDLASEPRNILRAFCNDVGFPYSDDLLQWTPSQEFPTNFVTPLENMSQAVGQQLYATALSSTSFVAPRESGPVPRDQLTNDVIECVDHSMPFYREMYENRLRPS